MDVLLGLLVISGEAGHGLAENDVDLPVLRVPDHLHETRPLFRAGARDTLVAVHLDHGPALGGADLFGVIADLGVVGLLLLLGQRADAGIARHPLDSFLSGDLLYDHAVSLPSGL